MKYHYLAQTFKTIGLLLGLLFLSELPVKANGQPRNLSNIGLTGNNLALEKVFSELEKQSGYTFLYRQQDVSNVVVPKLEIANRSFESALKEVLEPLALEYEIDDKVVIIRKGTKRAPSSSRTVQQQRILQGSVVNEEGRPLGGTSINIKGVDNQVFTTNYQGKFEIPLPTSYERITLVFRHVGMQTREVVVGSNNVINVSLQASMNTIEETVIVGGYGLAQKRSDMVGSAFQVTNEQIKNLPAQRVDNLLEGLVPGLQVDVNTDLASSTRPRMNLRVRGEASLSASNEPLWIVDGIRVYTGDRTNMIPGMSTSVSPLSYLNPDDIESITVLKDATMASIYGADGANGVILITTKKGRINSPSLNFSSRYGLAKINKSTRFKVLDADQYWELAKEAYQNVPTNDMLYFPYQDLPNNAYSVTNTDWYDVYYGTGTYLQNNLNISGGSEDVSYYVSGEYFMNQSTIKGNQQDRFSLRGNVDFRLSDKLKLGLLMSASYNVNDIFNPGSDYYAILPIISPYNADGTHRLWTNEIVRIQDPVTGDFILGSNSRRFFNSVAEREENDNIQRSLYTVNNLVLDYQISPNLKFTSQAGVNFQSNHEEIYGARSNWSGMTIPQGEPRGYSTRGHSNFLLWSLIERLNYNKQIGKHGINALLGFEASSQDHKSLSSSGNGFANDHIKEVSYAAVRENGASSASRLRRASFFGQGSYNYDSRYYLTLNWRADGNSDFGTDSQWGKFWSAGTSWNIHNEDFFQSDLLNVLKLKASFGTNGNSRLGSQRAQGLYNYNASSNYFGMSGSTMSSVWNRKLSWEQSYMTNIGVRANFKNRVDVELELYNKKTVDLLQEQDVTRATGDTRVTRNVGSTRNRGIELTIETQNIENNNFSWTTNLNISRNENQLVELYEGIPQTRDRTIWMEGEDLNTYFLVRWAGVDPRDGAPLWYDRNGNITRVYNNADRVPGKTSTPWFHGGITNTLKYKNLTMSILATYSAGGYRFTSFGRNASSDGLHLAESNQSVNQLDRWQRPGDLALSPKPLWQTSNSSSTMNSTRYLYNATFIRLKNISMAYELPKPWANRVGLKGASLTLLADNLGIWTPYDRSDRNSYKQAMSGYPAETTVSVGLSVNL